MIEFSYPTASDTGLGTVVTYVLTLPLRLEPSEHAGSAASTP